MKPSDERRLFLLSELANPVNRPDSEQINSVLKRGEDNGFSSDLLIDEIQNMDSQHEGLLTVQLAPTLGGPPVLAISQNYWLTSKGEDYLYKLQHPGSNEGDESSMSGIHIDTINNNGQAAFGDYSSFTDNHSQTINIDESIHQLLSIENQLPDNSDKEQLRDLAAELESALKSSETPKPKFLSRFKNFIGKTWEITGPVITPLLVELGKQTFF